MQGKNYRTTVPKPLAALRVVVPCPHCLLDGLKGIDVGTDLRTVTVRCSECGRLSVITVSEQRRAWWHPLA